MQIIRNPKRSEWAGMLERPHIDVSALRETVLGVLNDVREGGDEAVKKYEKKFDKVELESLAVSEEEMAEAEALVSGELKNALNAACENIKRFHASQKAVCPRVETSSGVTCWQKAVPIDKVGLYIPGGTAPLFSTVLMLAVPARIAGCAEIVLCSPPGKDGKLNPAILVAAKVAGVNKIYKIGGVQAIGAMAYGTESVPKVYKIFGPGNQYVMAAKQEVSQAEHGVDSQVAMVTCSESLLAKVAEEVEKQLAELPRKEIASKALENSKMILVENMDEAVELTNEYAPEHLILAVENYMEVAERIRNAGSVFLGNYSCESAGDYASGTNHTLPTSGYAKAYSGVNLDSFMRKITFQELTADGVRNLGSTVEIMAHCESLDAHCNAMRIRRLAVENGK